MARANKEVKIDIDEVWPINTKVIPNGGIGVSWSGNIGFGEYQLFWGDDGKLHADTEHMDRGEDKRFTKLILQKLSEYITIDD